MNTDSTHAFNPCVSVSIRGQLSFEGFSGILIGSDVVEMPGLQNTFNDLRLALSATLSLLAR